ncbi:MAG: ImmA/IrrE family metallo-endopeptidase [Leptospirillum sp.]
MRKYPAKAGPFDEALFFEQEEIEDVCETALKSVGLYPDKPEAIRIERFLEKKFGLSPEYDDLPEGVLGYTKFGLDGPEKVVLSVSLSDMGSKTSERRIATTIAHEAGHILFHAELFKNHFRQPDGTRTVLCRDLLGESDKFSNYSGRWWEHQANKAIGALLMPFGLLEKTVSPFFEAAKERRAVSEIPNLEREAAILRLSEVFEVNPVVAKIRFMEIYRPKIS